MPVGERDGGKLSHFIEGELELAWGYQIQSFCCWNL